MGHKCHRKPDIVLSLETGVLEPSDETVPLFLKQETCKYDLELVNVVVTKKKCRQLIVKGSSKGAEVIIQIQTGTDTPRIFRFDNDLDFELVENLKKGDRILFEAGVVGREGEINLDVKIVKRSH